VAPVFIFFSCGGDFLRSSLGPGWLELPIFDCRLLMDIGRSCHTTSSIVNRQSAIGKENLVFGCGRAALPDHYLAKSPAPESRMIGKRLAF
jgi:hypothetical protein